MTISQQKKNSIPAQALCFSKLKIGQNILAIIKKVNDFDLVLSLPDQLTAFTTCTQISPTLTKLFSDSLLNDGDDATTTTVKDVPSLKDYYSVGEYCIATISSIKLEGKKRLELSLLPSPINKSLFKLSKGINMGTVLSGTFLSKEDHGWVIDLGQNGAGASEDASEDVITTPIAFIPNENIQNEPKIGLTQPFIVVSSYSSSESPHLSLSNLKKDFANRLSFSSGRTEEDRADQDELRVGMMLNVRVLTNDHQESADDSDDIDSFIRVSMAGGHGGRVGKLGLPESFLLKRTKDGLKSLLEGPLAVGKVVRARIIFTDPSSKTFLLTLSTNHLEWNSSPSSISSIKNRIGDRYPSATVYRIDRQMGINLFLGDSKDGTSSSTLSSNDFAYCHVSRLEDDSFIKGDSSLEKGAWRVGTRHECRIIDRDAFSGSWIASLKKSLIKEEFLGWKDVKVGQLIRGEVKAIEDWGLLVSLNSRLQAVCPVFHLTETQGSDIGGAGADGGCSAMGKLLLKKYQIGQKYKFRVLDLQEEEGKCCLTRKSSILEIKDEKFILSKMDLAVVGQQFMGATIISIKSWGILVKFFNNVRGIIPLSELSDTYIQGVEDLSFWVGQVIPLLRVIKCDPSKGELVLSLRKQDGPKKKNLLSKIAPPNAKKLKTL